MITPAYSPTATERVLPRMALDFTTGSLDPRVTVTRALNTATRVNSNGYVEVVNADLPRFDYDPVTFLPKGLLIEETRQNRLLWSNDFANAVWNDGAPNSATVATGEVSPDGTTNGATLTAATGGTNSMRRQAVTAPGATTYAFSIFVKKGTSTSSRVLVRDNTNGTNFIQMTALTWSGSTPVLGGLTGTWSSVNAGNGWYRVTGTGTAGAGASVALTVSIFPDNAAGTNTLLVYGAQLEAGAFATSYIPTTTTSLTRNADYVSMTGTNFSSWFNATEGTFMANVSSLGAFEFDSILEANDGTVANRIGLRYNNASVSNALVIASSVSQASLVLAAPNISASKFVLSYKANGFASSYRGSAAVTAPAGTVPTVTKLDIGNYLNAGTTQLNGHMRQISYYALRLTDREVQAVSQ